MELVLQWERQELSRKANIISDRIKCMWKIKKAGEIEEYENAVHWDEVVRVLFLVQRSGEASLRDDIQAAI